MKNIYRKLAVALAVTALLLPAMITIYGTPSASAASSYGRFGVSGTNILINGEVTSQKFFGVVETTALQWAILAYIYGETGVAGKTSHLNGPDTSDKGYIPYHETPEQFWHQYFAISAYYDCNMVRMGAGDKWGTSLQYNAWVEHREQYFDLLRIMCDEAEEHGVWLCFVMAGSQEYPTFTYGGSGSVFDTSSSAYSNYLAYCKDTMRALEGEVSIAMWDVFNEPDHDIVATNYWKNDKVKFNTWSKAVASATAGISAHPRTMGIAGLGKMFSWGQSDFNLATGNCGFEILHRHYYASATGASNAYLFSDPEKWADAVGKPLYWGEIAYNGVYPLTRYTFGEQSIANAGGQLVAAMVLTGTPNYPYTGGLLPDPVAKEPVLAELKFTSAPPTSGAVGSGYSYPVTTTIATTLTLTTNAPFLSLSGNTVAGTPDRAGSFSVKVVAKAADGRSIEQSYTLTVPVPPVQEPPVVNDPDPVEDVNITTPGNNDNAPVTNVTQPSDQNGTSGNSTTGPGSPEIPGKESKKPVTKTVTSWRNSWAKNFFSWFKWPLFGGSSSVAQPAAVQTASSASQSGAYALGGTSDSSLAMISLAATGALAGAYFWVSRKLL
ncbi:MAG: hypothetical protein ISF22_01425 [Methanomassiliicoccus sp.]|nr:hypothetical protein [Methanomassiliicoccus sp.]